MESLKEQIKKLPLSPGIYQFYDKKGKLLYVGKSISIKKRVTSYFTTKDLGPKTKLLVKKIASIKHIKVFSEFEALLLESELIRVNQPFFNIIAKDDKSPIYIKISSDSVPIISLTRKEKPQKGVFLKGPFPSAKISKSILKNIRRIFPYCQHKNPRKPCLYVHLGLCPYPYQSSEALKNYLGDIAKIKKLLSGKSQILKKELAGQMQKLSSGLQYEKAQELKDQLEKLQFLEQHFTLPQEFLNTPSLVDDRINLRLEELQKVLNLKTKLIRIECYDISNTSGKQATGSMVVFTNGQSDKSQYRRFKIKFLETPNDFEMHRQIMTRRLRNKWQLPDLFIIDGGKGQLSTVHSVLIAKNIKIPIISLAKKLELIFTTESPKPIALTVKSPARMLVQEIRDESHRFAIIYHRKLRSNSFLGK